MSPRLSDLLLRSQSDERLVSLARGGHVRAFEAIVERYRPELYALARRLTSDERGEDIVQQALLSAFSALRSGTEVKHLRGWLYQIVRNTATSVRRSPDVPLDDVPAAAETLEEVVARRELALNALTELGRLPDRQREALVGTALEGRSRGEIAMTMGVSEGAVRQLVHRARLTLRTAVTAVTPWPLARWLAAAGERSGVATDVAAGAGAISGGGIVVKLGALLTTGALATGAVATGVMPTHGEGAGAGRKSRPADSSARPRSGAPSSDSATLASLTGPVPGGTGPARPVLSKAQTNPRPAGGSATATSSGGRPRNGDHRENEPGHRGGVARGDATPGGRPGPRDGSGTGPRDNSGTGPRDGSGTGPRDNSGTGSRDGSGAGSRDRGGAGPPDGSSEGGPGPGGNAGQTSGPPPGSGGSDGGTVSPDGKPSAEARVGSITSQATSGSGSADSGHGSGQEP